MGAAAVPAALAASKGEDLWKNVTVEPSKIPQSEIDAVVESMFSDGKEWRVINYPDVVRGKVNNREDCLDGFQFLKPEDAPLYTPKLASKLTQMPHTAT